MTKPLKLSKKTARRAGPGARSPVGTVVRAALADDVLRMLSHEPGARAFRPEDVHQIRTSVRRLRSDLRFFGPALPEEHAQGLRDELRWLAGALGEVRDLDVLEGRLREAAVARGVVTPSDLLFEAIDRRRGAARSGLLDAIEGDRYAALRDALIAEARSPTLAGAADRPAGAALVGRLARDWRRLLDDLRSAPADAPIEALHELRKRAKRTRYAAESVSRWFGDRAGRAARRVASRARDVQEALGRLQDAAVAGAFIGEVTASLPDEGPAREALATLIDHEDREAEAAREQYGEVRRRLLGG